ncbi:MAG: alpha-amylase [Sphaerochaetaceae bacterium]|nr:alpha-amylase [Sphaerochaetaceae bacterium]
MRNRDFRISENSREEMSLFTPVFETDESLGKLYRQAQELALTYNKNHEDQVSAAKLNISAVLHLIYQRVISIQLRNSETDPFSRIGVLAEKNEACREALDYYNRKFPSELGNGSAVTEEEKKKALEDEVTGMEAIEAPVEEVARAFFVHQVFLANPALLSAMKNMLGQDGLSFPEATAALRTMLGSYFQGSDRSESSSEDLFSFLTLPARLFPDSLTDQVNYIVKNWKAFLPDELVEALLRSLDYVNEEEKQHGFGGPGEISIPNYSGESEYEDFTEDRNWMPNVVMMAKSTLVWLDQLSKKYKRDISRLDQIPDEELDFLKESGFTALWLIGLWERSPASKKIKNLCGNPDAESSAYSLKGYIISSRLGGWDALNNLRARCWSRGIRLASDMVPNHTGLDSDWLYGHPEYFMQQDYPPFPSYSYTGADLSIDPNFEIKIEDHYFDRTDAAVTFMKRDKRTGETKYIFHGNDGTTMPWNDTAQLDFLKPETREAVIQQILDVARAFPIIRFDAAMTLAKRHIERLWYPKPGTGGDIAGRANHGMTEEEFNRRIPVEFWREVVDRIQEELPDTLLLAEAFWMMESYFVRTLGMHRVYNSAFMHMMKNQDNKKYRDSIKATIAFDPEILKRYVNFMNNPDEDTAIAQFGDGDKYFGICTMLATMPGLPMFGHGQIEGFKEKYGMEYQRAYWDETPNQGLIDEHRRRIFPLLRQRYLFSGCDNFQLYDVRTPWGVEESVYAFTNGSGNRRTLVLFNNRFERAEGTISTSAPKLVRHGDSRDLETVSLAQGLGLTMGVRRFVILRNFADGLMHLAPSMKIFDEGWHVSLNGYETKVYTDIREVEDVDGIYQQLYDTIGDRGVADIELEIRLLYLRPFFEAAQPIRNQKFAKNIKMLMTGKSSANARHEILQTLGTCYTYIEELVGSLEKLGLNLKTMKPASVLDKLKKLEEVCSMDVFANGNGIIEEDLPYLAGVYFLLLPFVDKDATVSQTLETAQTLLLDRFFEYKPEVVYRGALLAAGKALSVGQLIENRAFLTLLGVNEYQGVRWFRGECCQECMFEAVLSQALNRKKDDEEIDYKKELGYWLEKAQKAGYKVDNLR